jgi:hypothetical protein
VPTITKLLPASTPDDDGLDGDSIGDEYYEQDEFDEPTEDEDEADEE